MMETIMRGIVLLVEAYVLYFIGVFVIGMILFAPGVIHWRRESKQAK